MCLKNNKKQAKRKFVAVVSELKPGTTKKFRLINGNFEVEGILLNYQGSLYAYLNRCPHVGISLDWVDNQFFSIDGRYLMCANHGATFEPATGECIWGPCLGTGLQRLPLEIEAGRIFVHSCNQNDVD